MDIIGEPTINGNISTDIDWVPDGLILSFAEDAIFDAISAAFVERVPAIASSVVTASLFAAEIGDVALDVALEDLDNDRQALAIGMDVEAEWRGDACVISGVASQPAGRSPRVDFGARDDADVAVGVTEYQLNRLFHGAGRWPVVLRRRSAQCGCSVHRRVGGWRRRVARTRPGAGQSASFHHQR